MSTSYYSIIEGLERLRKDILPLPRGNEAVIRDNIGGFLASIWYSDYKGKSFLLNNSRITIDEFIEKNAKGRVYNIVSLFGKWGSKGVNTKWIDQPPKNWEHRLKISSFLLPTAKNLAFGCQDKAWIDFHKGILNVFFRLTNYNAGAMVPIQDLIDLQTARYFSTHTLQTTGEIKAYDDFIFLRQWGLAVEGILFTLKNMDVQFPAPYYPGLAVLEKKDSLQQALIDLEKSFKITTDKKE